MSDFDSKLKEMTLAIDFDGVIHKYSKKWHDGTIYDEPVEGVKEALGKLKKAGYRVIIFTARLDRAAIQYWMIENGMEKGAYWDEITNMKIPARVYIDDRGLRFLNWKDTLHYFV